MTKKAIELIRVSTEGQAANDRGGITRKMVVQKTPARTRELGDHRGDLFESSYPSANIFEIKETNSGGDERREVELGAFEENPRRNDRGNTGELKTAKHRRNPGRKVQDGGDVTLGPQAEHRDG